MMTNVIVDVICIVLSIYIAFVAFKKYLSTEINYEHTLYWGISFTFICYSFILYLIHPLISFFVNDHLMASTIHFTDTLAWWLQLFAIMFVIFDARNSLIRKKIRVVMFLILLFILIITPLCNNDQLCPVNNNNIIGLQTVGIYDFDIFIELIHSIFAFSIAFFLYKISSMNSMLWFGYVLLGVSEIFQVINILCCSYNSLFFSNFEWGIAVSGMAIIFYEVHYVIKNKNELH